MGATEQVLFFGSFYIFTVQAQLQADVDCDKFPLNPLCSLSQINKLSLLEQPQASSLESLETHRSLDLRSDPYGSSSQRYGHYLPGSSYRVPGNFGHRPAGPFRGPLVPPSNFRPDPRSSTTNRNKRFYFWYNPADLMQAKKNHWKTQKFQKMQKLKDNQLFQWKPPNQNLAYDEYDCVHGKLKPISSNILATEGGKGGKQGFFNLNGQPIILASPVLIKDMEPGTFSKKLKKKVVKPVNYAVEMEEMSSDESSNENRLAYMRDHAPETTEENLASLDTLETSSEMMMKKKLESKRKPKDQKELTKNDLLQLSPGGERIEFQVQGHNGPKTYIFGFDTGDGKNRQYRLEERMKDGTVKGQYGYYDARGKLRTIKYVARPTEGYKEKHHEVNLSDLS